MILSVSNSRFKKPIIDYSERLRYIVFVVLGKKWGFSCPQVHVIDNTTRVVLNKTVYSIDWFLQNYFFDQLAPVAIFVLL